jgi:hypothetical protein
MDKIRITSKACAVFLLVMSFTLFHPFDVAFGNINGVSLQASVDQVEVDTLEEGHQFIILARILPTAGSTDLLYGASLDVVYDPKYLEVLDVNPLTPRIDPMVIEGDILNEEGASETFLLSALANQQPGVVTIGLTRKGPVDGVLIDEGGMLLSVHFRAVGATEPGAPTTINFGLAGLQDSTTAPLTVANFQSDDLTILELVVAKLDLNDDDIIDLKDLILAMQVHTDQPTTEPVLVEADLTGDGIISMAEAVGIIQVISELRVPPQ